MKQENEGLYTTAYVLSSYCDDDTVRSEVFCDLDSAQAAMKKEYEESMPWGGLQPEWEDASYCGEMDAVLYRNGVDVFTQHIAEVCIRDTKAEKLLLDVTKLFLDTEYCEPEAAVSEIADATGLRFAQARELIRAAAGIDGDNNAAKDYAVMYIQIFCEDEYGEEIVIDDLSDIPIAYTTSETGEEIQVSVDLENCRIINRLGDRTAVEQYGSVDELSEYALRDMDFDTLISEAVRLVEQGGGDNV